MFLPKLRDDLRIQTFTKEGEKFIVLHDDLMIATQPVAIPEQIFEKIKSNADPKYTITNSSEELQICDNLSLLGFMDTPQVRMIRDDIRIYLKGTKRQAVCAGNSYPDNYSELKSFMNQLFQLTNNSNEKAKLIFAPHIDFRVGDNAQKIYAETFSNIDTDTELFIILGTAHYKSSDLFMFTRKNFVTPFGEVKVDKGFLRLLQEKLDYPITFDELAHKPEHSIELHLILLQYLMGKKDFKILPILTGSFYEFIQTGISPQRSSLFNKIVDALGELIETYDKKITILASGDMSHIGRKFGDEFDAISQLDQVEQKDKELIKKLLCGDKEEFFKLVSEVNDNTRICGLSPFYSSLSLVGSNSGALNGYSFWNEEPTSSAVSFCGITYS